MTINQKREELKKAIEERTWMVNDARLFTWAKCEGRQKIIEKLKIGGGNFLTVLGLFSVLNFLAKTYFLLHDGSGIWTIEEVRQISQELNKSPETKGAVPPPVGSPKQSEAECFVKFALDLEFPLFQDSKQLSTTEQRELYEKIWRSYRNKLAHMAMPAHAAITLDFGNRNYEGIDGVAELLDNNTEPAFVKQGANYAVYPDLFIRDIKKWIGWLNQQIDDPDKFPDEQIQATLDWINGKFEPGE